MIANYQSLFHINEAEQFVNKEVAISDWITLDQERISSFASSSMDMDWMHVDVDRCKRESPYGTTIAPGFLLMSLVIHLAHESGLTPDGTEYGLNYGMDRVRFTGVVPVGSRIRSRITLLEVTPKEGGRFLHKTQHIMEVEGQEKPSMIAEWLVMWFAGSVQN